MLRCSEDFVAARPAASGAVQASFDATRGFVLMRYTFSRHATLLAAASALATGTAVHAQNAPD